MRGIWHIRLPLLLGVFCLGLVGMVALSGYSSRLIAADECPSIQNTPAFTIVYGPVTVDGNPAAVGTVVEALSPRGTVVGCQTVRSTGILAAMYIYGEDTSVVPTIPGMRDGETVTLHLDGNSATLDPLVVWHNDKAPHETQISALAQVTVQIPLVEGWNLVSLPVQPSNTAPATVLAPIEGKYRIVFAYRSCDIVDHWKKWDPSAPAFANDLTQLDSLTGLWIQATAAVTLTVSGPPVPVTTTLPLCSDWNLVGYPSTLTAAPATALASINTCYSLLFGYKASDATDPWKKYDPAVPPFVNDLATLQPRSGYWIKATQTCNWAVQGR